VGAATNHQAQQSVADIRRQSAASSASTMSWRSSKRAAELRRGFALGEAGAAQPVDSRGAWRWP